MPFIRHLRDRRGYETTVVMHGYRAAQGSPKSRVLYLFRSPAHIRIGREALDEEAREALEHTHPDLSFDWIALARERDAMRAHSLRERERERDRPAPSRSPAQADRPRQPVKVVIEDHSTLGRTLGADKAATLRTQYAELVQRIHRRARTPEERERLLDQAHRLNPDDWVDAGPIPGQAATFEADRQAILAELPSRRRGRRGGRRGDRPGEAPGPDVLLEEAADASAIMATASDDSDGEEGIDARAEHSGGSPADTPADHDRLDGGPGAGSADQPAAGHGLPGDDELRRH